MTISQRVRDLTAIALQDRIITFKERQTIIKAALKDGASKKEINAYINNALAIRLKSYTKEELGSCPGCGHGVPLIANDCPYCGRRLEHQDEQQIVPPQFRVTGQDADVIKMENTRTAEEKKKKCPKCGAAYPLVSNICPYCKYILHEQTGSDYNITQLLNNIKESIDKLKKTTRPSFFQVLKYRGNLLALYIGAMLLMYSEAYDGNVPLLIISLVALITALILTACFNVSKEHSGDRKPASTHLGETPFTPKGPLEHFFSSEGQTAKSPIDLADDEFYLAYHNSEKYRRQIDLLYVGDQDNEAERLIAELNAELKLYKKARIRSRSLLLAIFLMLLAPPFVSGLFKESPAKEYDEERNKMPDVYMMADYSKDLKLFYDEKSHNPVADYFIVGKDAKLKIDVVNSREENSNYGYLLRISADLISSGKISAQPDTVNLRAAIMDKNWNIISAGGLIYLEAEIRHKKGNYRTIIGKGSGHIHVDFVAYATVSATRVKDVADRAYYFTFY